MLVSTKCGAGGHNFPRLRHFSRGRRASREAIGQALCSAGNSWIFSCLAAPAADFYALCFMQRFSSLLHFIHFASSLPVIAIDFFIRFFCLAFLSSACNLPIQSSLFHLVFPPSIRPPSLASPSQLPIFSYSVSCLFKIASLPSSRRSFSFTFSIPLSLLPSLPSWPLNLARQRRATSSLQWDGVVAFDPPWVAMVTS